MNEIIMLIGNYFTFYCSLDLNTSVNLLGSSIHEDLPEEEHAILNEMWGTSTQPTQDVNCHCKGKCARNCPCSASNTGCSANKCSCFPGRCINRLQEVSFKCFTLFIS